MLAIERGGKIDEEKTAPEGCIYFLLCVQRGVGGELRADDHGELIVEEVDLDLAEDRRDVLVLIVGIEGDRDACGVSMEVNRHEAIVRAPGDGHVVLRTAQELVAMTGLQIGMRG